MADLKEQRRSVGIGRLVHGRGIMEEEYVAGPTHVVLPLPKGDARVHRVKQNDSLTIKLIERQPTWRLRASQPPGEYNHFPKENLLGKKPVVIVARTNTRSQTI
jgi:hypothetical protein